MSFFFDVIGLFLDIHVEILFFGLLSFSLSLDNFFSLQNLQKILWIGPLRFSSSKQDKSVTFKLAEALGTLSSCNTTFVGRMEFEELLGKSNDNILKSAAIVWEVLKGKNLPGLMALDRVCFHIFLFEYASDSLN